LIHGDCLEEMYKIEPNSVDCCVTSPPYWGLRDYGDSGDKNQLGQERHPQDYINNLLAVFDKVRNLLKPSGCLWVNIGDTHCGYWGDAKAILEGAPARADRRGYKINLRPSYEEFKDFGAKPLDLMALPFHFAIGMRNAGWFFRQSVIWAKPDRREGKSDGKRPTTTHEYVFLFTKSSKPYVVRPTSWPSVWTFNTTGKTGHPAAFPVELPTLCIEPTTPPDGTVLDPFMGSGTTGVSCINTGRNFIGIEQDVGYFAIAKKRMVNMKTVTQGSK
jgi:site-specific DNA-methyltransferase (cytosine-N4-specific)